MTEIIMSCFATFVLYIFARLYLMSWWDRTAQHYCAWFKTLYPDDNRITYDPNKIIDFRTFLCPWKWHIRHYFTETEWKLLENKLGI